MQNNTALLYTAENFRQMHLFKWLHLKNTLRAQKPTWFFFPNIGNKGRYSFAKNLNSHKIYIIPMLIYILSQCISLFRSINFFKLQHLLAFKLRNPKTYLAKLFNNSSSVKALPLYIKKPVTTYIMQSHEKKWIVITASDCVITFLASALRHQS